LKVLRKKTESEFGSALSQIHYVCHQIKQVSGVEYNPGGLPHCFRKDNEVFHGIVCYGKGQSQIRFNLLNSQIHSISYWQNHAKSTPDHEIVFNGFPIKEVIDTLCGLFKDPESPLHEKVTGQPGVLVKEAVSRRRVLIMNWIDAENIDRQHLASSYQDKTVYKQFVTWCQQGHLEIVTYNLFKYYLHEYFESIGDHSDASRVPSVSVNRGSTETYVEDNPQDAATFNAVQEVDRSFLFMYDHLEMIMKGVITTNRMAGVYIYGSGGIGKSYNVEAALEKYGATARSVTLTGAIQGYEALAKVLFKYRKDKIIVFDDNDKILDNETAVNILKGALNSSGPRKISISTRRGEAVVRHETVDLNALGHDIDSDDGIVTQFGGTWNNFELTSKVIFISNKMKIPQPIADRCMTVRISLTKPQFFIYLDGKLTGMFKEYDEFMSLDEKRSVFMSMQEAPLAQHIKQPTFRLYKKLLELYLLSEGNVSLYHMAAMRSLQSEMDF
jgi:hypothetical protein